MKKDYDTEAIKLAKAVDIAIDSFTKFPPKDFTKENLDHVVKVYSEWKNSILNPEPKFRKIASLKYHIQDVFTYFQESGGEAVEYFWRLLDKENLGFTREDKLRKIIDRGKIKGLIEYDLVVDSIVAAEQEKRISRQEANQLSKMLGEFESRKQKKK
ncbi:hypothetical protein C943_00942 [Mariniradius saccharolyticus AK6]|uniref:Uncharacterized protein n=1 Tax=Mariniradius saccharolyticus AK6 TaxID=1239962 RepID=M7X682_9BACT|nr:hypothetical protein [Mariniradius saccharolyticus]EMS32935.1 hypothetical protein C943_00942 [Mariniradius saccharolyticus AK6]